MRALFNVIDKKRKQIDAFKKEDQTWIRKVDEIEAERKRVQENIQNSIERKKRYLEKQVERIGGGQEEPNKEDVTKHILHSSFNAKDIPDHLLVTGFRKHRQPILLFGETKEERFMRLYDIEHQPQLKPNTKETLLAREQEIPSQGENNDYDAMFEQCRSMPKDTKHASIGIWIANTLQGWQQKTIAEREEFARQGNKAEVNRKNTMLVKTMKELQPLVKMLNDGTIDEDILDKIYNVVECCNNNQYKEAHTAYMRLAIGNSAWPMGVTMVGIHERAGRSKISTSEIAHILDDETTRKYIQMIKRLISYAESTYITEPTPT